MIELIHQDKIRADDIIIDFLIINTILFALFYRLEILMALIIYPFISLFFYGIMKIMKGTNRRNRGNHKNLNRVLYGISSIIFSIFFLNFFLGQNRQLPFKI